MPTLAIIDMQPCESPSQQSVDANVKLAKWYRKRKYPVVLVYYAPDAIHPEIENALNGYEHVAKVNKANWDGSEEILQICRERQFPTKHVRLSGTMTCCCVRRTWEGLKEKLPKARVATYHEAVYCRCGCHPKGKLISFPKAA